MQFASSVTKYTKIKGEHQAERAPPNLLKPPRQSRLSNVLDEALHKEPVRIGMEVEAPVCIESLRPKVRHYELGGNGGRYALVGSILGIRMWILFFVLC